MDGNDYSKEAEKAFEKRSLALMCLYIGLVLAFFLPAVNIWLSLIPAVLILSFIILSAKYWRCPSCDRRFEMRQGAMDKATHCPYCGVRIRYDITRIYK